MKKIFLLAFSVVFALAAYSQTNTDELKYLQSMFGMDKKHFIAERMQITKADSAKFWSDYDEYELFRSEIADKRAGNVQKYSENYSKLTVDQTDALLKTTFEINDEFNKLLQKTYKIMAKDVSALKAGQFVYLEFYCEALGRVKLAEMIPTIGQVPELKK